MGEQTIVVCDVCGQPAAETVTIRAQGRNLVKDLCKQHVDELVKGARRPRPGRRKGVVASTGRRRGRPPKSASAGTTTGRRRGRPPKSASARTTTGRRRGRPPKSASAKA